MTKTYVVAGKTGCGTTAMMKALIAGGIPGLYRKLRYPERPYPHQVYEVVGGPLPKQAVEGHVVKQFDSTLVDNLPDDLDDLLVVYMTRDFESRLVAHHMTQNLMRRQVNFLIPPQRRLRSLYV